MQPAQDGQKQNAAEEYARRITSLLPALEEAVSGLEAMGDPDGAVVASLLPGDTLAKVYALMTRFKRALPSSLATPSRDEQDEANAHYDDNTDLAFSPHYSDQDDQAVSFDPDYYALYREEYDAPFSAEEITKMLDAGDTVKKSSSNGSASSSSSSSQDKASRTAEGDDDGDAS